MIEGKKTTGHPQNSNIEQSKSEARVKTFKRHKTLKELAYI